MKIHKDINCLPVFLNAVITIGSFDGVHKGHLIILEKLYNLAKEINGESVVITFYPHPKMVVGHDGYQIQLLNTLEEKEALIEKAGIDHLVIVPFSSAFAEMEANTYISDFLVKKFRPHTLIIGYDHRFGKNRAGDIQLLQSLSSDFNFKIIEIPEQIIKDITVSSTKIRQYLLLGATEKANELLGYNYHFTGVVVEGEKMGRKIGFPTANLVPEEDDKLIPSDGVYIVWAQKEDDSQQYKGMMNIGMRPTFGIHSRSIEVHILNFKEEIYGCKLKITVLQKIRDEIRFENAEGLIQQLTKDLETTKAYTDEPSK